MYIDASAHSACTDYEEIAIQDILLESSASIPTIKGAVKSRSATTLMVMVSPSLTGGGGGPKFT